MLRSRGEQIQQRPVEELVQTPSNGVLVPRAVKLLEAAVPADDSIVAIDDGEAIVQRLEDILAELPHALQLVRLDPQLAVEAAILEGRCGPCGDPPEQPHI